MHDMWEQLNDAHYQPASAHHHHINSLMLDCGGPEDGDCWGPGPPPEFRLPPPPRPPFLQELTGSKCTEEPLPDIEMCSALPAILDPSYHISPSQTSTLIFVCSVLLVFTICLSTFVVWKHKRKVPGFMQCKTPTRDQLGAVGRDRHDSPGSHASHHASVVGGSGSLYEDPDLHIGRVPLMLRHQQQLQQHHQQHYQHHQQHYLQQQHHHNAAAEALLPAKSIHYPSGYPMPHSPPIFVCSSPGPDPYRSHDNVYEELDQQQQQQQQQQQHHPQQQIYHQQQLPNNQSPTTRRNSDAQSMPSLDAAAHHSDDDADDFAADELSINGLDTSLHKQHQQYAHPAQTISTIYHERRSAGDLLDRSASERNSLLSTSSSSTQVARSCLPGSGGLFGGGGSVNRQRQQTHRQQQQQQHHHTLQTRSGRHHQQQQTPPSYEVVQQQQRSSPRFYRHPANSSAHILSAAPSYHQQHQRTHHQYQLPVGSFAASLQHDVEVKRRNQLNTHLSHQAAAAISTIYQTTDPLLDTTMHTAFQQQQQASRARTNPRPNDRRRAQNVYVAPGSAGAMYGTYRGEAMTPQQQQQQLLRGSQYPSYISPAEFSTFRQHQQQQQQQQQQASATQASTTATSTPTTTDATNGATQVLNPITSRDSSFGSDSGYSHHTLSSNHLVGLLAESGAPVGPQS